MDEPLDPVVNNLSRPFWDAAGQARLVLPFCASTGRPFWPPSPTSPFVTGGKVEWRDASATGRLCSRVVYRRVFQKALAERVPYGIGLVELEKGVRLQVHIADPEGADAPRVDDDVTIVFLPLVEGGTSVPQVGRPANG